MDLAALFAAGETALKVTTEYQTMLAWALPIGLALAAIGSAYSLGKAISAAMAAMGRQPEIAGQIQINEEDVELYFKANKEKYVVKDDKGNVKRHKFFQEVQKEVAEDMVREKQQKAYEDLLERMMRAEKVEIYEDLVE